MFLIDDILLAPVYGTIWLGQRILDAADAERYDETKIRAELLENQELWMAGELSDEDYRVCEDRLLKQLEEARRHYALKHGGNEKG